MIKKYTSLVLVAMLVVHLAGFYVYFAVRLGDIRMTMREKLADLPEDQLDVVRIPVQQFKSGWIEEREMQWQGNMYDIARVERQEDTMIVYCVHDEDEDNLLNFIGAIIDMGQQDTRPAPMSVVQFFTLKYVVTDFLARNVHLAF